ncbi:MAG: hypothetical protein ACRDFR_04505 [Candidatus Limnocylindria bacterium]
MFYLANPIDARRSSAQHRLTVNEKRRLDVGVGVVIAAALVAGCVPSASPELSPTASAALSVSTAPSAEPSAAAACDASAHADGILVLRVEHFTETGRQWVISVYDDGRILTPGTAAYEYAEDTWMVVRRVTADGVAQLAGEIEHSELVESSASYWPIPLPGVKPPGRGGSGYTITFVRPSRTSVVSWTSMFGDDALYYEPSPEREQLDALAAHFIELEAWLPPEAWVAGELCSYRPRQYELIVQEPQQSDGDPADLPADISDVEWPLGGEMSGWGEPFSNPSTDPDIDGRCGEAARSDVESLVDELLTAGAKDVYGQALDRYRFLVLRLGDRANAAVVDVIVVGLLPDEPACALPQTLPFGAY